jgi:ketosteroid isomerase-like protein
MAGDYGRHGAGEDDVHVVHAIYAAFARRDIDAALAHVADDVEFEPSGTSQLTGRTEPYRGHDGLREYFADAARVWDELTLHADDVRAMAGSVIVFGHAEGRVGGAPVRRGVVWVWRIRDGKAISMRANDVGDVRPG